MTEQEQSKSGAGVQNLVDRIRDQGVLAATEKANKILQGRRGKVCKNAGGCQTGGGTTA